MKRILAGHGSVQAAVAYWGNGAVNRLNLSALQRRDVKIVCNVTSGGCNITEIKLLQKAVGAHNVLTCDTLHAKMWLTDTDAIIGSSNASTNGYGIEGSGTARLLEANVWTKEPSIRDDLRHWMDTVVGPASRLISKDDLRTGDRNWHHRSKGGQQRTGKQTVLKQLRLNPLAYEGREVFVMISPVDDLNKEELAFLEAKEKELGETNLNCWIGASAREIRTFVPSSFVIEFDSRDDACSHAGLFRILDQNAVTQFKGQRTLLCENMSSLLGAPLGSMREWCEAANRALADDGDDGMWIGSLHQFASKHLR